ncbi:MAG: DUF91 domain-containing protein [Chloroflexi bacterium]|nr:DUF91 domain-containing protein [Chloroflexota bacterium]NOG36486.1 DUF91 domain-containing protein [Chloroflexota bacterium]
MMDWSAFGGAAVGAIFAVVAMIVIFAIWDYFDRRKAKNDQQPTQSKPAKSPLDDILESHLEEYIIAHFGELFPGWKIVDVESDTAAKMIRPLGVRRRTEGGEIDILCTDNNGDFVVIELKRNRAPDEVVAQIDRYMAWVEQNLVQPNQQVRGIIIARKFSKHLNYTLSRRSGIDFWLYDWQLNFTPVTNGQTKGVSEIHDSNLNQSNQGHLDA